jgi:uracil-DNA glycosylase
VSLGGRTVLLYPLFHPAAALYTPRTLDVLQADFARLPDLLGRSVEPPAPPERPAAPALEAQPIQLGLF